MRARSLFFALAALGLFAACNPQNEGNGEKPEFGVTGIKNGEVNVLADGKTIKLTVTSNISWKAESDVEWLNIDPSSFEAKDGEPAEPQKVSIEVDANPESSKRVANVVISADGFDPFEFIVNQAGRDIAAATVTILNSDLEPVTNYSIEASCRAQDFSFVVKSNVSWTIKTPEWVLIEPTSHESNGDFANVTVALRVEQNTGETRTGEIVFEGDYQNKLSIPVTQKKSASFAFTLSDENPYPYTGAIVKVDVDDDNMYWAALITYKSLLDKYGNDAAVDSMLSELNEYTNYISNGQLTADQVLGVLCAKGSSELDYVDALEADTEFSLAVVGVEYNASLNEFVSCSLPGVYSFKTEPIPASTDEYASLVGTYKMSIYDYFASQDAEKDVYYDMIMKVSPNHINEDFSICFPGDNVSPEGVDDDGNNVIDSWVMSYDATAKNLSINNGSIGSMRYGWRFNGVENPCAVFLMVLLNSETAEPVEKVKLNWGEDYKTITVVDPVPTESAPMYFVTSVYERGADESIGSYFLGLCANGTTFTRVEEEKSSVEPSVKPQNHLVNLVDKKTIRPANKSINKSFILNEF